MVNKWSLLTLMLFTLCLLLLCWEFLHLLPPMLFNTDFDLEWTLLDGCLANRCSTSQSGSLTKTDKAVDGIFGFGPGALSVVSQLSSRGITPKVFSHCLKGDGNGGGILVLGEILAPSIVYSPLVPSQYVLFCTSFLIFFPGLVECGNFERSLWN